MDGSDSFVRIIVFVVFVNHGNTCRESIWFLSDLHSKKLSTYQSGLWTLTTLTGKGRIKECEMLWPVPTEVASYMYLPSCETGNLKITQLTCLWDCDRRHLSSNCKIMWISVVVWRLWGPPKQWNSTSIWYSVCKHSFAFSAGYHPLPHGEFGHGLNAITFPKLLEGWKLRVRLRPETAEK